MLKSTLARIAALIVLSTPAAVAQSPREIAEKVMPSVVLLMMQDQHGQPLAMASGFVVRDGIVLTNFHAIEGAGSAYASLVDQKPKGDEETRPKEGWRSAPRIFSVKGVVASDPEHDLVLLSVDGLEAAPLTVADSEQVAIGDEVYVVGNPQGLEGTFSAGIVSGIRNVGEGSLLQITAPISPGSSGGPVLNTKGEVIGVAVATFKGGQNLNFAIPSQYLCALIAQQGPPKPLSQKAKAGRQGPSIVEAMGDRVTEGVTGADFIWDEPLRHLVGQVFGGGGQYRLTLRNNLRDDVRNVRFLVLFYNRRGEIIETREDVYGPYGRPWVEYQLGRKLYGRGLRIRAGLAERVTGVVHKSVQELATPIGSNAPDTKVEIRILDFEIVDPQTIGESQ